MPAEQPPRSACRDRCRIISLNPLVFLRPNCVEHVVKTRLDPIHPIHPHSRLVQEPDSTSTSTSGATKDGEPFPVKEKQHHPFTSTSTSTPADQAGTSSGQGTPSGQGTSGQGTAEERELDTDGTERPHTTTPTRIPSVLDLCLENAGCWIVISGCGMILGVLHLMF